MPLTANTKSRRALLADLALIGFLSLFMAAWWSGNRLLNQDEMFSYQTDTVRSLAEVVRIQRHYPISLDPMVYHALAHLSTLMFGATVFAMRLPSMLGYTLMLGCLYVFCFRAVRARWPERSSRRIAQFAALLPLLTAASFYATEARPYGLLLGFTALAAVGWQAATRDPLSRRWSLPLLGIALALALNTHYFAVLLLPVFYLAEFVRTLQRRRLDIPLVVALLLGTAAIAGTLPFLPAVRAFRSHYYSAGAINLHAVTQAYRSLLVDYTSTTLETQRTLAALLVVAAMLFLAALVLRWRSLALPPAEATLLVALAALPLFGFLLAHFVTHSYEVRYVLGAIFGITILLTLLLAPWIAPATDDLRASLRWLPYMLFFLLPFACLSRVNAEKRTSSARLKSLEVSSSVRSALAADPTHSLYVQQMGHYELAQFYQPDPIVRAHTVLVYDRQREIRSSGHDTEALTAEHMQHFTALRIVRYDTLIRAASPQTWLLYTDGWDFAHKTLPQEGATVTPIAPLFQGTAVTVRFPQQH